MYRSWFHIYLLVCSIMYVKLMMEQRQTTSYTSEFTSNWDRAGDWVWGLALSFIPPFNILLAFMMLVGDI